MTLDVFFHLLWTAGAIPVAWRVLRILSKLANQLEEYPLHRHVELNGAELIQYPKGVVMNDVRRP